MRKVSDSDTQPGAIGWDAEAEGLLRKVPFFVRPFARRKVEEYVRAKGENRVTTRLLEAARGHFMGETSPGAHDGEPTVWQLDACRGEEMGCPFAITPLSALGDPLREVLDHSGWREFLERSVTGPVLHHHRLRVAVAACPNACSQPQIKDIGIIASLRPTGVSEACTGCGTCVEACREGAVEIVGKRAVLRPGRCVGCGLCVRHCPAKAMQTEGLRFRLLAGGKLGRHPRFATEVASELREEQLCGAVRRVIEFIKAQARPDERVGDVVERMGGEAIASAVQDVSLNRADSIAGRRS